MGGQGNDLWLSGSYDHAVKLWDTRSRQSVLTSAPPPPCSPAILLMRRR